MASLRQNLAKIWPEQQRIRQFWWFCGAHVGGLGSRKSKKYKGLEMASAKGAGIAKSSILVPFVGLTALEAGNPKIQWALEMASGKGVGIAKSTWCFCGVPPHFHHLCCQENQKSRKSKGPWKGAGIAKSTILVLLWCSPSFRRPWKPESQEIQGALEMASGKGGGACKIVNVGAFCGVSPISAALEAGNPRNTKGLGNGIRKKSGYGKIGNFAAFAASCISAALEAGNPRNTRSLGNGFRKRSGYCKINNFGVLVVFHHFGGLGSREIQEIQEGALEMASGKRAGMAKSAILLLLLLPAFRRPWKPEIQELQGALEMASGKRSGYCKVDNFGAFVVFPFSSAAWKPEIQEIQGAVEMASGKERVLQKSTILVLLWGSPHFGGLETEIQGIQGSLEMASGKRADFAKSTTFGLLCGWSWLVEKSGLCARSASQILTKKTMQDGLK